MQNPFDVAAKAIGLNEGDKKAALTDYLTTGGANLDPATLAWCAAFVNSTLKQAGIEGTGSNMARSFLDWGQPVDKPQKGDIAVFSRGDPNGPYGHVGFFEGYNPDGTIRVLGGNQGDAVSVAAYSPDQLLGFRRGEGNALQPQAQQPTMAADNQLRPFGFGPQQQTDITPFMRPLNRLAFQPITVNSYGA